MFIFKTKKKLKLSLPLFLSNVKAGFPSPADDYIEGKIDLNEYLIQKPSATFLVRCEGDSMTGAGIFTGDMMIVDRSLEVKDGDVVVAIYNGEFTIKRFKKTKTKVILMAENPKYQSIEVDKDNDDFEVWGVVTNVIHKP